MKYFLEIILAVIVIGGLIGAVHFYRVSAKNKEEMAKYENKSAEVTNNLGKVLVVYYSLTGHTKDIAEKTGLDISTVSRVSNSKYVQTRWGIFPLRFFFNDAYTTAEGEELSTHKIKAALRDMIDGEDPQQPLSDETLRKMLSEKGFPIARRTVAKYREQLGIPIARMRK